MSVRLLRGTSEDAVIPFVIPSSDRGPEPPSAENFHAPEAAACIAPDSEKEAEAILSAAQQEAALLVAQAREQTAELETAARRQGLEQAQQMVEELVSQRVDEAVSDLRERLRETLQEIETLRSRVLMQTERELVQLALDIARKIIRHEITTEPAIALTLTRVALEKLRSRNIARVRLHPEDVRYLRGQQLLTEGTVELIEDTAIGRGGCIVQSERGEMDARIETQLALMQRELLDMEED
jgi:flagellar assembly protein FliH